MALHLATFRTRTITAVVFVLIMLLGLLWNHWSFFILFTIIHFGCWKEYQQLISRIDPAYAEITPLHKYGVRVAGWCIMLYFTNDTFSLFGVRLHELGWWLGLVCVFILPIIEILFAGTLRLNNIGYSALGLVYISLSFGLLIDIRCQDLSRLGEGLLDMGWITPCVLIFSIWINDTMAYIVGSLIGRTPLTRISPKKTWEGTAGGALLAVAVISFAAYLLKLDFIQAGVIAAIAAVTGTIGDICESKLKRMADVKDSGQIMPGHGGFLDRFDSLLFAIPFTWLYIELFT